MFVNFYTKLMYSTAGILTAFRAVPGLTKWCSLFKISFKQSGSIREAVEYMKIDSELHSEGFIHSFR